MISSRENTLSALSQILAEYNWLLNSYNVVCLLLLFELINFIVSFSRTIFSTIIGIEFQKHGQLVSNNLINIIFLNFFVLLKKLITFFHWVYFAFEHYPFWYAIAAPKLVTKSYLLSMKQTVLIIIWICFFRKILNGQRNHWEHQIIFYAGELN